MKGNSYYSRKIHSLLGVIPLSMFIISHMLTNFSAVEGGAQGFKAAVSFINGLPILIVLEIVGIWLPLLFHGVYGLYIAYQSDINTGQFKYGRNWAFALQRISGVITFIFVAWHVYQTRIQVFLGNIEYGDLGATMNAIVSNNFFFLLYMIGVVASVFHFANGMWAFLVSWGITVGPRAQRISSYFWMVVFVIVTGMFLASLMAFRGDEFKEAGAAAETLRTLANIG
ncbi:MAG TPA: succinate dehydrogenase cytochrome b558 subunit [Paenibacillus sp.]|uniref:succinate dehydrogenase cytochrome b558 subunit n=1 Tax=Paenibacillus sp. TaxID=58172 RepID=UPI0028D85D8C|nr:succinate dehydrogenase cytochrome b558 subunit [Paenibacillus sp.]HUC92530.1 succinate dehydrogenase cytochrome b558 subunit [Paenibacillus sp.]